MWPAGGPEGVLLSDLHCFLCTKRFYYFWKKNYFYYLVLCIPAYGSMQVSAGPRPGAAVTGGCEPLLVDAGTRNLVIGKCSVHSSRLSCFSSPYPASLASQCEPLFSGLWIRCQESGSTWSIHWPPILCIEQFLKLISHETSIREI